MLLVLLLFISFFFFEVLVIELSDLYVTTVS